MIFPSFILPSDLYPSESREKTVVRGIYQLPCVRRFPGSGTPVIEADRTGRGIIASAAAGAVVMITEMIPDMEPGILQFQKGRRHLLLPAVGICPEHADKAGIPDTCRCGRLQVRGDGFFAVHQAFLHHAVENNLGGIGHL